MGNLKTAFDSARYAIAILALFFVVGMLFGVSYQFGHLFSWQGFVAMSFLIFALIAK